MQSIHPDVKRALQDILTVLQRLTNPMANNTYPMPAPLSDHQRQIAALPTGEMHQVIGYDRLVNVPMELEGYMSGGRLNGSRLEWLIACHYARVRVEATGRSYNNERPTVDDIKDAQRVATVISFLGA
jgi:hypothetical protein